MPPSQKKLRYPRVKLSDGVGMRTGQKYVISIPVEARIKLVGVDDRPVPGERFILKYPDGKEVEGKLDARGVADVETRGMSDLEVTFPDLDAGAWEPAE